VETGNNRARLEWVTPLSNGDPHYSPSYRVRTKLLNGSISSASSPVGPEMVQSEIEKVVIRKIAGGSLYPTYDQISATTVAEITDLSISQFEDELFQLSSVFNYSIFVVDKSGNVSIGSTVRITQGGGPMNE
jgi:hypothetical protein